MPALHFMVRFIILPRADTPGDQQQLKCFLMLASICSQLWLLKHSPGRASGKLVAQRLLSLMSTYISECKILFGPQYIKPKHHYMYHVPLQYLDTGHLLDCFTHERKHRLLKRKLTEQQGPLSNPSILHSLSLVQLKETKNSTIWKVTLINARTIQGPFGTIHLEEPVCFMDAQDCMLLTPFHNIQGHIHIVGTVAVATSTGDDVPGLLTFRRTNNSRTLLLRDVEFFYTPLWSVERDHIFLLH